MNNIGFEFKPNQANTKKQTNVVHKWIIYSFNIYRIHQVIKSVICAFFAQMFDFFLCVCEARFFGAQKKEAIIMMFGLNLS